jgi:hypothetical protein
MKAIDTPPIDPRRIRIWRAREASHRAACQYASLDGGEIAHVASGVAGRWCFNRSATDEQLQTVISIMRKLYLAAAQIERLECGNGD